VAQSTPKHVSFASVDAAAVDMIDRSTKQPRRKHKAGDDGGGNVTINGVEDGHGVTSLEQFVYTQ
jgi:hypothetical protein